MKTIINNKDNLKENEITDIVRKVKLLIINSKNEILLGYSYNNYQFPGGTQEKGEELIQTVKREILEETGIELENNDLEPFACLICYYKDWPSKGKNKKVEIYYYELRTDKKPNMDNINLTKEEKEGNFCLKYINLDEVENEIINNINVHNEASVIGKEMLTALEQYKRTL